MPIASRSFDRAADFYDQTRELPEPVATHGIPALLQHVAPGGKILDVGTGTGRMSVPLLRPVLAMATSGGFACLPGARLRCGPWYKCSGRAKSCTASVASRPWRIWAVPRWV